jgi:hypothetical protein
MLMHEAKSLAQSGNPNARPMSFRACPPDGGMPLQDYVDALGHTSMEEGRLIDEVKALRSRSASEQTEVQPVLDRRSQLLADVCAYTGPRVSDQVKNTATGLLTAASEKLGFGVCFGRVLGEPDGTFSVALHRDNHGAAVNAPDKTPCAQAVVNPTTGEAYLCRDMH